MASGWVDILTGDIEGDERTWTLTIERFYEDTSNGPGSPSQVDYQRSLMLSWGDNGDIGYGENLLPSKLKFAILDPDDSVFDAITAEVLERRYRVVLTEDTSAYYWRGFLRRDTSRRPLFNTIAPSVLKLYAYCGLSEMGNLPILWDPQTGQIFNDIVVDAVYDELQDLPIQYALAWYPKDKDLPPKLDEIRWREHEAAGFVTESSYDVTGRRVVKQNITDPPDINRTKKDQIKDILDNFGMRLWQGFYLQGSTSRWNMIQRFITGETADSDVAGSELYDGTLQQNNLTARKTTLSDADIEGIESTKNLVRQISSVQINTSLPHVQKMELLNDPAMSNFVSEGGNLVPEYWEYTNGVTNGTIGSNTGFELEAGESVWQPIFHIARGTELQISVRFDVRTSGTVDSAGIQVKCNSFSSVDNDFWLNADEDPPEWQPSLFINSTSGINTTEKLRVASTLAWPADGILEVYLTHSTGDTMITFDASVEVFDRDGNQLSSIPSSFPRKNSFDGNTIFGEKVKYQKTFADVQDQDIRDGNLEGILEVLYGVDWERPDHWVDEDSNEYNDIAEITARDRIAQQDQDVEALDAKILDLIPPEEIIEYDGTEYITTSCEMDLIQETTQGIWFPKLKTLV